MVNVFNVEQELMQLKEIILLVKHVQLDHIQVKVLQVVQNVKQVYIQQQEHRVVQHVKQDNIQQKEVYYSLLISIKMVPNLKLKMNALSGVFVAICTP